MNKPVSPKIDRKLLLMLEELNLEAETFLMDKEEIENFLQEAGYDPQILREQMRNKISHLFSDGPKENRWENAKRQLNNARQRIENHSSLAFPIQNQSREEKLLLIQQLCLQSGNVGTYNRNFTSLDDDDLDGVIEELSYLVQPPDETD